MDKNILIVQKCNTMWKQGCKKRTFFTALFGLIIDISCCNNGFNPVFDLGISSVHIDAAVC